MSRKKVGFIMSSAVLLLSVISSLANVQDSPSPDPSIKVILFEHFVGKPPIDNFSGKLVLINPTGKTLWFALPHRCNTRCVSALKLNKHIVFAKNFKPQWIEARMLNDPRDSRDQSTSNRGKAIILTINDPSNQYAFDLFRIPAGGNVVLEKYQFMMTEGFCRSFKWSTLDRIIVNGKQTIETWLPYETTSDPNTYIQNSLYSVDLNIFTKTGRTRTDFKKESIVTLDLEISGTWESSIENYCPPDREIEEGTLIKGPAGPGGFPPK